ncbi:MAG: hypothetical protein NZ839_02560 [Endomicrobia bacterium]|nr:hypothetical protein [Endomicrobiia bacterium]MCX7716206.1 hypothetical protein [Endomicrobiia bacterium]
MKKKTGIRKSKYEITIDHPKDGEVITHKTHYAVRIGTPNQGVVEISIDGSPFVRCRQSVGYWWYDWVNIPSGKHILIARLVNTQNNRTLKKSNKVSVTVK